MTDRDIFVGGWRFVDAIFLSRASIYVCMDIRSRRDAARCAGRVNVKRAGGGGGSPRYLRGRAPLPRTLILYGVNLALSELS